MILFVQKMIWQGTNQTFNSREEDGSVEGWVSGGSLNFFTLYIYGLPGGSVVKNPPTNAGDTSSIPRSGRSPGEENGNLLQYSCLGNPVDRGAWWATVHGAAKESDTTK